MLLHAPAQFTIADIRRGVPGVWDNTIRLVLTELKAAGNDALVVDAEGLVERGGGVRGRCDSCCV